jgi:hypothetical protein
MAVTSPAITRVLPCFTRLGYIFFSKKIPSSAEKNTYFLESQMKVFYSSMKKIQSGSISGGEVAVERNDLSNKMKSMRDENFSTTELISLLRDVGRCLQ